MINLEQEIEENLSRYEDLLSSEVQPSNLDIMRESLLGSLGEYEALAKEIRHLPVKGDTGSSQERIQKSIAVRAGLFLQKKMLPLKVSYSILSASLLTWYQIPTKEINSRATPSIEEQVPGVSTPDANTDIASRMQPLLEQEAILESFIDEAKARRKFDDVQSLTLSLKEIRGEINSLSRQVIN
jgi:hypothetical protein